MDFVGWGDRSVLEAASWRLGSELVRRHPTRTRLFHGHPGGGQYDVLWVRSPSGSEGVDVPMNRNGTIQVHARFDGESVEDQLFISWDEYLRSDPRVFLDRLERAAGLPAVRKVPAATPMTLTYRVLAAIAASAVKSVHPIAIQPGFIDTSGYGGGPNGELDAFPVPADLLQPREDDPYGEPGLRFWIVLRDGAPVLAFEADAGIAWTSHHPDGVNLMTVYNQNRRHLLATALGVLSRADNV